MFRIDPIGTLIGYGISTISHADFISKETNPLLRVPDKTPEDDRACSKIQQHIALYPYMERSLQSFVRALGECQSLRQMYRSDPIMALAHFGIPKVSYADFVSKEAIEALLHLPDMTHEDGRSYTQILMHIALYPES
jgi:hypothetical protein